MTICNSYATSDDDEFGWKHGVSLTMGRSLNRNNSIAENIFKGNFEKDRILFLAHYKQPNHINNLTIFLGSKEQEIYS